MSNDVSLGVSRVKILLHHDLTAAEFRDFLDQCTLEEMLDFYKQAPTTHNFWRRSDRQYIFNRRLRALQQQKGKLRGY